jgi:hypothetical protein
MTFMMLGCALELFSRRLLQILRLQVASRHRPIAFAPEGLSLDHCLPVNNRVRGQERRHKSGASLTSRIGLSIGTPEW